MFLIIFVLNKGRLQNERVTRAAVSLRKAAQPFLALLLGHVAYYDTLLNYHWTAPPLSSHSPPPPILPRLLSSLHPSFPVPSLNLTSPLLSPHSPLFPSHPLPSPPRASLLSLRAQSSPHLPHTSFAAGGGGSSMGEVRMQ